MQNSEAINCQQLPQSGHVTGHGGIERQELGLKKVHDWMLGINIFGLGFVTSITFIFLVGVFMSLWLEASVLSLGEWFIKRMPFVRHIYNASKQASSAISPDQNTQAFKEVAIIRHPRIGVASSHHLLFFRITQERRSYTVYTSQPTIFILVIYSWSMPMMLYDQTYLFEKELKLLCPVECQCPWSYQHWIQGPFRWTEVEPTEP